ncbi:hypothetical protein PV325_000275 [Microctonus aethiopoides]|nr:hypothetical protein PV325_000275 [Microctonus aethiopoides]
MRRHRGLRSAIIGFILGFLFGFFILNYRMIFNSTLNQYRGQRTGRSSNFKFTSSAYVQNVNLNISQMNLVFVGVMTAEKYLDTRAKAVYETWGKEVPGQIAFFSSEYSRVPNNCKDLPLVSLPTVDDGYPPQKKSFLMLQWMWNNFGDKFEWFLRADDDVYIRTDRLEKFLRSVDSRKPLYIGQAGRGNSEEFGLLSLEYDENFCMGGPGVILSRETMKRIIPHVKDCLKNLYTTHEDVELGRCVRKHAGIPCTWSYEMQSILYHNSSGEQAFTGNLKRREVHRAITLHPVKSPPHMYRLHNYMRGLKIQDLQYERVKIHRDLHVMAEQLGIKVKELINELSIKDIQQFSNKSNIRNFVRDAEILGVPAGLTSFKPRSAKEVIPWDFISRSEYSLANSNPRRRIHSDVKEGLEDITREVMASINACSRQRGRVVEERQMLYGYRRVDAYGADTILDLLLVYRKYRGRKVTLPVRRHVYVHQHFTGMEIREIVNDEEVDNNQRQFKKSSQSLFPANIFFNNDNEFDAVGDKVIRFILPLSGRYLVFERFLRNYEEVCLIPGDKTELVVVLYGHKTENSIESTVNLIEKTKRQYSNANIQIIFGIGDFSRAKALDLGVTNSKDNDLMLFIDVDIAFTSEALERVRLNTVINRKIYFPIVFSQYDPEFINDNSNTRDIFVINELTGYWRQFGFGIVSLYKCDYLTVGGFDVSINGWGKEDVDFFEKTVKSNLEIFRAPDKHLIHVYHKVVCDEKLSSAQMSMCKSTTYETLASVETLAQIINDNPEYLKFARARIKKNRASGG